MKEDNEILYLAAVIDGDGTIEINKSDDRRYRIRLEVNITSRHLIHYLQENYGGNVHGPYISKQKTHKDHFLWECSTKEAIKIIKQIQPYLVIKQAQAELALEAWNDTFKWDYSRRGREIPKYAVDKRKKYHQYMRHLNMAVDKADSIVINNIESLYYLAGIIDTEGTIKITRQGHYHQIGLVVDNTSEELINYLQYNYGGMTSGPHISKIEGNKDIFVWQCNGKGAIKIIKKIEPYLIIKQKQAELVIEAYKDAFEHSYRGGGPNNRVPVRIINKREEYYQQMKKLNQVGKVKDEEQDKDKDKDIEVTLKINKNTLKQWLEESE